MTSLQGQLMGLARGLGVEDALVDWREGVPATVSLEFAVVNLNVDGLFDATSKPPGFMDLSCIFDK